MDDTRNLDAALRYLQLGWSILPVVGKRAAVDWKRFQTEPPDEAQLREWFESTLLAPTGVAVVTGNVSRLVVVDYDPRHDPDGFGAAWFGEADPPNTLSVQTGRGDNGFHLYYRTPTDFKGVGKAEPATGVEIRFEGHFVVAPPSAHPDTGGLYRWQALNRLPNPDDVADAPDWLLSMLRPEPDRAESPQPMDPTRPPDGDSAAFWLNKALDRANGGNRNAEGFNLALQLRDASVPESQARTTMLEYASAVRTRGDHPYRDDEATASLESAYGSPARQTAESQRVKAIVLPAKPRHAPTDAPLLVDASKFARTEAGFADLLAAVCGDDVRFDHARNRWLVWDGVRWRPDATGEVERRALVVSREVQRHAADVDDKDLREKVFNFGMRFEGIARLRAGLDFLKVHEVVSSDGSEFDRDAMLLGVANGVVDLRSGEFRESRRDDFITLNAGTAYDPHAECPRWERFMREVFDGDDELVRFVQRAVGYSLAGMTTEQTFFLLYGHGANGKTTFLNALGSLLGDYGTTADFASFLADKNRTGGSATPDLTALIGRRFVSAREVDDGARFSAARMKTLTGGDPIACRELYGKRVFSFQPAFKTWLAANAKPVIRDDSVAMWRRVRLVPFVVSFVGREDRNLESDLRAELGGILSWAIAGCLAWQRDGLGQAGAVKDATDTYRTESDALADFFAEHIVEDAEAESSARDVFAAYQRWALSRGERLRSQTGFGRALTERGFPRTKRKNGWFCKGLRLAGEAGDGFGETGDGFGDC